MPVMDGIAASRTIRERWPDIQVILLSSFVEKGLAQSALEAGASGYLIKDITAEELVAAIQKIHLERQLITPKTLASQDPLRSDRPDRADAVCRADRRQPVGRVAAPASAGDLARLPD